jgi:Ctr copper transporter family
MYLLIPPCTLMQLLLPRVCKEMLRYYVSSWVLYGRGKFKGTMVYSFLLGLVTKGSTSCMSLNMKKQKLKKYLRVVLYVLQVFMSYILMRIPMTYSVELLLSVVAGIAFGYFVSAATSSTVSPKSHDSHVQVLWAIESYRSILKMSCYSFLAVSTPFVGLLGNPQACQLEATVTFACCFPPNQHDKRLFCATHESTSQPTLKWERQSPELLSSLLLHQQTFRKPLSDIYPHIQLLLPSRETTKKQPDYS